MKALVFFLFLLFTQNQSSVLAQTLVVDQLAEMPSNILETSGLETGPNGWFWTHNDSGNPAEIHCIDSTGTIQRTVSVIGDVNTDWEEMAKDDEGNLYIGNFGNNALNRTDLHIIKLNAIDTVTSLVQVSDTIIFTYPDQYDFPPNGDYGNFDMEAMLWYQDSLHLFSKDRSSPSTGYTKHYRLPQTGGTYQATLVDSLYTGSAGFLFAITAADISEDESTVALLNADHIWLISNFVGTDFCDGTVSQLALGSFTQKEALCFRNGFIYLTDEREQFFGSGGFLYRLHPGIFVEVSEIELDAQFVYNSNYELEQINFPHKKVEWRLMSLNGKLVESGVAIDKVQRSDFNVNYGVYVIQLESEGSAKAQLVKL